MSLVFNSKLAANKSQERIQLAQWNEVMAMRQGASYEAMKSFCTQTNSGQTPADAYRELDSTTKIDMVPAGEHATLTRLMQKSRSVSIGREVFEYRRSSDTDTGQSSMSGQIGVKMDHVDYSYDGTVIPIHDNSYGRRWREVESMRTEAFDATVDDARECERKLMTTIDNYLWDGNASLNLKGRQWLGIKNDPSVASATLAVDLSSSAAGAQDIRNEVRRVRDILWITNNCTKNLRLGVSREIMSNWERVFSTAEGTFGTILTMIVGNPDNPASGLRGIVEVYEDSKLVGNQITMYWDDQQGFHPVVGMGISSYAVPRQFHNSDYNWIKWAAVGFLAKTDFAGRTCALYGET